MKLLLLLPVIFGSVICNKMPKGDYVVTYKQQQLNVHAEADNTAKSIQINLNDVNENDECIVENIHWENEQDMNRKFILYDNTDAEIFTLSETKPGTFALPGNEIKLLNSGTDYYLYTMAIPKDPNIASTVRVRRILVCIIKIK